MSDVYIVHCIDTEGPLYESLDATFERIKHVYHLDIEPSAENLKKLQLGEMAIPDDLIEPLRMMLDPNILSYNTTWKDIDYMLDIVHNNTFRNSLLDSDNNGWKYNWFCCDFVGYDYNPRRRDMGYHAIFDHYSKYMKNDFIGFHYHPRPFKSEAHICATNWLHTDYLFQILSRRIIDRNWFPAVNRPGFQVNRPDSNWFLEQYIPFDYSNMSCKITDHDNKQSDFSHGRSGDWRRAPMSWVPYHPSHDDYQIPGDCRRWIARCLNIGTRSYLIDQNEVNKSFELSSDQPQILSFTNHDFRDISIDIDNMRNMLSVAKEKYPDVKFHYSDPISAIRNAMNIKKENKCEFETSIDGDNLYSKLSISTKNPTFGPQPYFCIKTKSNQYFHDNLDFQVPFHDWTYVFDMETFNIDSIDKIGIASNNSYGVTSVCVIDPNDGNINKTYYNL